MFADKFEEAGLMPCVHTSLVTGSVVSVSAKETSKLLLIESPQSYDAGVPSYHSILIGRSHNVRKPGNVVSNKHEEDSSSLRHVFKAFK